MLVKLETDYYDHIDKCDLVDFSNYLDGFYLFRDTNTHFYSKSIDKIFRKALSELDNGHTPTRNDLEGSKLVESINKHWLENIDYENKYVIGLFALNKLTLLNSDGKGLFFFQLITNHYEKLPNEKLDVLAFVLTHYHFNITSMRLSSNLRELYLQLFNNNILKLIENIDKLKLSKVQVSMVDWLSRLNMPDENLIKYKKSLVDYYLFKLKFVQTVPDFITIIKCLSILANSFNRETNSLNIRNSFFKTYDPIFNKIIKNFVKTGENEAETLDFKPNESKKGLLLDQLAIKFQKNSSFYTNILTCFRLVK